MSHNNAWGNINSRNNIDMPNLQALGLNPSNQNPSNQNMNNPLGKCIFDNFRLMITNDHMHSFPGVSLNLNALPMNPAIVAAALNQWSLMGNLQNQGGGNQEVKNRIIYQ